MAYQQQSPGPGQGPSPRFQYLNSNNNNNSPFGDTTLTKVFVGGLAWETKSETMRRYFQQFGEILEAVVITDKNTGRSKGYGFVTFQDPDSAWRACSDPSPVIDGRRANCNLASLGRTCLALPFGHLSSSAPYAGTLAPAQGAYIGSFGYRHVPYGYQQGLLYSPYGYTAYGADYVYHQGAYNPFGGQHYLPVYGIPGTVNTTMYPYSQLSQAVPGSHSYTALQGYAMPAHPIAQFSGPNVNPVTNASISNIQMQYPTGVAPHPQFILPAHSPQFTQGSGSDQNAG